jgi:hypothetical protein
VVTGKLDGREAAANLPEESEEPEPPDEDEILAQPMEEALGGRTAGGRQMTLKARIQRLPSKDRRGSRIRCLLLTDGSDGEVARRLSNLAAPFASVDPQQHAWMPRGLKDPGEARLARTPDFVSETDRDELLEWWLVAQRGANKPNWDIASTVTMNGREGLLLVEAKAHEKELKKDGKRLDAAASRVNSHFCSVYTYCPETRKRRGSITGPAPLIRLIGLCWLGAGRGKAKKMLYFDELVFS